jgi:protease II
MTIRQSTINLEFAAMKHLVAWGLFLAMTAFARAESPPTKSVPVTDNYYGVPVTEHYRWLEDWNNPAALFLTGANDPRVDPMQSRKITVRLQAATASSAPILLRTSAGSGHGGDTALAERIEQSVDVYAFLFNQLGIKFQRGAKQREP